MKYTLLIIFAFIVSTSEAQLLQGKTDYTKQDTLRGSITAERE